MEIKNLVINEKVIQHFFQNKCSKLVYQYSVSSYLLRGLGYMHKKAYFTKLSDFTGISTTTAYRWLEALKSNDLITEKKGVLYIKGKRKLSESLGIRSKNGINFLEEHLKNYNKFKEHAIQQTSLLVQKRFRYKYGVMKKNTYSLEKMSQIETSLAFPSTKDKVGCSLSYIAKYLNISKTAAQKAMVNVTTRVYNFVESIKRSEFLRRLRSGYFTQDYKYTWRYSRGSYLILYKLSSVVVCESSLKRLWF